MASVGVDDRVKASVGVDDRVAVNSGALCKVLVLFCAQCVREKVES